MKSYAIVQDSVEESDLVITLKEGFDEKYFWYKFWTTKGILRQEEVNLYIGMTYGQTVTERLLNKHKILKLLIKEGVKFNITLFMPLEHPRITKEEISNIEKALIAYYKPEYNSQNRIYKGPAIKVKLYADPSDYFGPNDPITEITWDG